MSTSETRELSLEEEGILRHIRASERNSVHRASEAAFEAGISAAQTEHFDDLRHIFQSLPDGEARRLVHGMMKRLKSRTPESVRYRREYARLSAKKSGAGLSEEEEEMISRVGDWIRRNLGE